MEEPLHGQHSRYLCKISCPLQVGPFLPGGNSGWELRLAYIAQLGKPVHAALLQYRLSCASWTGIVCLQLLRSCGYYISNMPNNQRNDDAQKALESLFVDVFCFGAPEECQMEWLYWHASYPPCKLFLQPLPTPQFTNAHFYPHCYIITAISVVHPSQTDRSRKNANRKVEL